MENIGSKIKELRLLKGLTQEDLADKTGLSVRTIQRIESGEVDPRTYTLNALAEALDVALETFTSQKINTPKTFAQDEYNWVILMHFSGIFILVLPPILVWMFKKNEIAEYEQHFKDVMNFQISIFIYLMISAILFFVLIGLPLLIFLGLFSTIVVVLNTIKVMNHEPYNYPWTIEILK
ncbi:MAG: helix-turn-helix domain-containing protein [Bacteroidales bacterium]|jgi:transcriptional regulator with XRE-family HTH domain|nr:helix-turn-helix domain-containing protein [Bacteroidales bacterium]